MPNLVPIVINDGEENEKTFSPAQNSAGTTVWVDKTASTLESGTTVIYQKRQVSAKQTTRKSSLSFQLPLIDTCAETCSVTSRGNILLKVEAIYALRATTAERTAMYDDVVKLLSNADIRSAFIENGTFYS